MVIASERCMLLYITMREHIYANQNNLYNKSSPESSQYEVLKKHDQSKLKNLKKCMTCNFTYDDVEEEKNKENLVTVKYGAKPYKCKTCTQRGVKLDNSSAPTRGIIGGGKSVIISDTLPITRRIMKYNWYHPTHKLVRSIKGLMIEAHIDQYHAF